MLPPVKFIKTWFFNIFCLFYLSTINLKCVLSWFGIALSHPPVGFIYSVTTFSHQPSPHSFPEHSIFQILPHKSKDVSVLQNITLHASEGLSLLVKVLFSYISTFDHINFLSVSLDLKHFRAIFGVVSLPAPVIILFLFYTNINIYIKHQIIKKVFMRFIGSFASGEPDNREWKSGRERSTWWSEFVNKGIFHL